ncbi:MAG: PD40 domain-containing protein [Deltaproteobacteria bacterium]|nr:PD40 domain-containing protein [Deltaproteobacteria bacterium]
MKIMKFLFKCFFIAFLGVISSSIPYAQETEQFSSKNTHVKYKSLITDGGHLSWSKANNKIAFDRLGEDGWFDLWTMNSDGTEEKCLTGDHPVLPDKHIGQPAWHPSGKFMVIQAMKPHVPDYAENKCRPGAGALNDLWIITEDGTRCWKLHPVRDEVSKDSAGVLHPHFSHDGSKLFWAERIRHNGRPFGEWILRIADFSFDETKGPTLKKIRNYNPGNLSSFFESHSFSQDDKHVLFTGNQDGPLEIYEMEVTSGNVKRLTYHSIYTWDEHAHYSPDGKKIVWMSSRDVRFEINPFYLEAEFWIMDRDGSNNRRLTWFHQPGHPHYLDLDFAVAADFDWNPDGKQIAGLIITHEPDTDKRGSGIVFLIDIQ